MEPLHAKRRELTTERKKPANTDAHLNQDTHRCVPFQEKVLDLDGLKSGPAAVWELLASPRPPIEVGWMLLGPC